MQDTYNIDIIQGDTFSVLFKITFDGANQSDVVSDLIFSSKKLNIVKRLIYYDSSESFLLSLDGSLTGSLKPGWYTYDITMKGVHDDQYTLLYEDKLIVRPKNNSIEVTR